MTINTTNIVSTPRTYMYVCAFLCIFFVYSSFWLVIKAMWIDKGLMDECKNDNPGDMVWKCMFAPVSVISLLSDYGISGRNNHQILTLLGSKSIIIHKSDSNKVAKSTFTPLIFFVFVTSICGKV